MRKRSAEKLVYFGYFLLFLPLILAFSPVFFIPLNLTNVPATDFLYKALLTISLVIIVACFSIFLTTAIVLHRLSRRRVIRPFDFILLSPLLLGEIGFGASFKLLSMYDLSIPSFAGYEAYIQYIILMIYFILLVTQASAVFTLLSINTHDKRLLDYSRSNELSGGEFISYLRPTIPSSIVKSCILITLILCISTSAVNVIGFRSGYGYGLELWPQLLQRTTKGLSAVDPKLAIGVKTTLFIFVSASSLLLAAVLLRSRIIFSISALTIRRFTNPVVCRFIFLLIRAAIISLIAFLFIVPIISIYLGGQNRAIYYPDIRLIIPIILCTLLGVCAIFLARGLTAGRLLSSSDLLKKMDRVLPTLTMMAILIPLISVGSGSNVISLKLGLGTGVSGYVMWSMASFAFLFPIAFAFSIFISNAAHDSKLNYATQNQLSWIEYVALFVFKEERSYLLLFALLLSYFAWCSFPISSFYDETLLTLSTLIHGLAERRGASLQSTTTVLLMGGLFINTVLYIFGKNIENVGENSQ